MRYLLIDEAENGSEPEIYDSLQELRDVLEDRSERYSIESQDMWATTHSQWVNGLELYQIGEAIPVKVERTVLVTFGDVEPAERGPTIDEMLDKVANPWLDRGYCQ